MFGFGTYTGPIQFHFSWMLRRNAYLFWAMGVYICLPNTAYSLCFQVFNYFFYFQLFSFKYFCLFVLKYPTIEFVHLKHSTIPNSPIFALRIWLFRAYKLRIFMFSKKLFLLSLYSNWLLIIVCFALNLLSDISILSVFLGYHGVCVVLTKNVILDSILDFLLLETPSFKLS